jgi:6-phosphofructokinase 1
MTPGGRAQAYDQLMKFNINALIAIGGNGTFTGATEFAKEFDIPFIGLPGTIDNDLYGTDYTIGFDTAVNTVTEAADKIRDTATSHDRLFFIQVMGRDSGYIALWSGVSTGAEFILVPETKTYIDNLSRLVKHDIRKNKTSGIVIVAEGDDAGNAELVAAQVKERIPELETRVTILGHIQRGGSPTAWDRMLASMLGYASIKALKEGQQGVMVGLVNKQIVYTPFEEAIKNRKGIILDLLEMSRILAL